MSGPVAALLNGGQRLHLQHGPIDLIIGADPKVPGGRRLAFEAAAARFETILSELVEELPLLRRPVSGEVPQGAVARRMARAVLPHTAQFVTPMAAVAGAVAEEVLEAMTGAVPLARAYVNNGGDIALHLELGQSFTAAMAGLEGHGLGRVVVTAETPVRGIATSGQGGRSQSFGIAESVTVLARSAAEADVAATLIANAVDLPGHPAIRRAAACELHPDSDLGAREIVTHVGPLTEAEVGAALDRGVVCAKAMRAAWRIVSSALSLRGQQQVVGDIALPETAPKREVAHA